MPEHTIRFHQRQRPELWLAVALPLVLFCCGCPLFPTDGGTNGDTHLDTNRNNSLETATPLDIGSGDVEFQFNGAIGSSSETDVYDLGTLNPGDHVFVDIQRTSNNLDPVAAIFDSRAYLIAYNDDRESDGSNLDPQIDFVLRGAQDTYYLAVIAYPGNATTGYYSVTLQIERGVGVPSPVGQVVYLDWVGGSDIHIRNVGLFNLPPFSATDVGLAENQTAALKDRVQEIVAERYAGLNLTVLNSDDDLRPSTAHSTVYFGGRDFEAFAISEQIDSYNTDPNDDAIIFTRSFRDVFGDDSSLEQMSQALGNTVAHEVGHLLGLVHTCDCDGLMDTTCYNERLLAAQFFKTSPLDDTVFPFGSQNAQELLGWVLGFVGF